jgi:hypothetical protein
LIIYDAHLTLFYKQKFNPDGSDISPIKLVSTVCLRGIESFDDNLNEWNNYFFTTPEFFEFNSTSPYI